MFPRRPHPSLCGAAPQPCGVSGWRATPRRGVASGTFGRPTALHPDLQAVFAANLRSFSLRASRNVLQDLHLHAPSSPLVDSLAFRLARRQALWQCPPARARNISGTPVGAPEFSVRWPSKAIRQISCRSSVVEHSLGKGEVESSIPSGSTSLFEGNAGITGIGSFFPC